MRKYSLISHMHLTRHTGILSVALIVALQLAACSSTYGVKNVAGRPTQYIPSDSPGLISRIGIESQDIVSMTDKMVRDLLATPDIAGRSVPPRILIDGDDFNNQSSSRINKNIIAARIRNNLNRASHGKIIFIDRQHLDSVMRERSLKRSGNFDSGTIRKSDKVAGIDFKMTADIMSDDKYTLDGRRESYFLVVFQMLDMEYSNLVWTNSFEFTKSGQPDAVYR